MTGLILKAERLSRPFMGVDPFLFCAYHVDHYPHSDGHLGIDPQRLADRPLGNDFSNLHGYSMYYGNSVPGFPMHPHRGFETVTIVRSGFVDHADSMGARGRYGMGDVQWLTTGAGVQHAEMFSLLDDQRDNPLELFQIWLNLPARSKFAQPAYKMLWSEEIPFYRHQGAEVMIVAGAYAPVDGSAPLVPKTPPPDSWGAQPEADLVIWLLRLEPGAHIELPAARLPGNLRTLYVYDGDGLQVGDEAVGGQIVVNVDAAQQLPLRNAGSQRVQILLMQGMPLNEPVAAGGPFVMNTEAELHQARVDYGRTHFGGWPWDSRAPTFGNSPQRFAQYAGSPELDYPPAAK
ncbi:pirin family protein [Diaphorobacter caeni]|uniref:pirin family protein n=1 Tax=Diaphorobacter caeni TaxID=2784387 RepID=UPI00189035EC|nr:pirin family protein [Diaphorobacter caeni]MBF5004724.1 pirin family protein [Diaphorobacter caeni]